MEHLDFHLLVDYVNGNLPQSNETKVGEHLAACNICQQELEVVRRTLAAIEQPEPEKPPNSLVQRAQAAFRHQRTRLAERIQQLPHLEMDSWASIPVGARGAAQERQLLYSLDGYDLDVQIFEDRATHSRILRGQVLPIESDDVELMGLEVRLIGAEIGERRTLTDEIGQFSLTGLAAGSYELQIVFDDVDVLIKSLTIET